MTEPLTVEEGEDRSTRRKPLATSFRKCHILKPEDSSPKRDSNPHNSIGGRLGKQTCLPLNHASPRHRHRASADPKCRAHGKVATRGRCHGGRRLSSDDSFLSPSVIPPSALDKPSIMKRYHRLRATRVRCDCTFADDGDAS